MGLTPCRASQGPCISSSSSCSARRARQRRRPGRLLQARRARPRRAAASRALTSATPSPRRGESPSPRTPAAGQAQHRRRRSTRCGSRCRRCSPRRPLARRSRAGACLGARWCRRAARRARRGHRGRLPGKRRAAAAAAPAAGDPGVPVSCNASSSPNDGGPRPCATTPAPGTLRAAPEVLQPTLCHVISCVQPP